MLVVLRWSTVFFLGQIIQMWDKLNPSMHPLRHMDVSTTDISPLSCATPPYPTRLSHRVNFLQFVEITKSQRLGTGAGVVGRVCLASVTRRAATVINV